MAEEFTKFLDDMSEENRTLKLENADLRKMLSLVCAQLAPKEATTISFSHELLSSMQDYEFESINDRSQGEYRIHWRPKVKQVHWRVG